MILILKISLKISTDYRYAALYRTYLCTRMYIHVCPKLMKYPFTERIFSITGGPLKNMRSLWIKVSSLTQYSKAYKQMARMFINQESCKIIKQKVFL